MSFTSPLSWVLTTLIAYLIYKHFTKPRQQLNLPPGPKPFPLLGNVQDFPPKDTPEFQHWLKHKDLYGPISTVTALGSRIVIIHDKKAAHDLLDRQASKTSGRPSMVFANQLCGYESIVLCQGHNNTFRRYRKLLHQELGTKVSAAQFRDVQELEVKRQLVRALNEPEKWLEHFKTTAAATVLKMTYGYTIEPNKPDVLVTLTDRMMTEFSLAAVPMAWAVDILPFLRHLPDWFPGTTFKKTARKYRNSILATAYIPYRFVQRQMAANVNQKSYVSKLVNQFATLDGSERMNHEDEEAIIWSAASLYGAAADTTVITLTTFTLAMILYPQVQRKAQEEIDTVIGSNRLPTLEDREKLPYINALVKETLRWWPIAPMGFPHAADSDVEYEGLHIPKGSYLLPAVWWFLHDPEVYSSSDIFDPDRFLSPRNELDPGLEGFGYGRRICPGRFFADSSLYLNIAQSLATYNILRALDADGKEVSVEGVHPKPGILSYPSEFHFRITPRSERHVEMIRKIEREYPWEVSDAELLRNETS